MLPRVMGSESRFGCLAGIVVYFGARNITVTVYLLLSTVLYAVRYCLRQDPNWSPDWEGGGR